jgi:hypothetical protein
MTLAHAAVLAVGAVVIAAVVPRPPAPSIRRRRRRVPLRLQLRRSRGRGGPSTDLAAVERLLSVAVSGAEDEHVRLRPVVLGIARQRLADHAGVRIDASPETAAAILGPEAWELVRPDRPPPADRRARGITPAHLQAVVESLERIGPPA